MSAIIRQSVLTPKLPAESQVKTYWSRLYGSAKSLTIANIAVEAKNPIVVITKDVLAAINLVDGYEIKFGNINYQMKKINQIIKETKSINSWRFKL